jgi:cholest-4-en-3-one 26-monooxygenase
MLAFYDNRDEWRRLVANPGLLDPAIEEIIRWTTPVIQFSEATRDCVLRGTGSRRASRCVSSTRRATATRTSSTSRSASASTATRTTTSASAARARRLGAHLARLELRTVFDQIRARLESFERTGKEERVRSSFVGGLRAPITWKLRPAKD